MKTLELEQMERFEGGLECSSGLGVAVGVIAAGFLLGVVTAGVGAVVVFAGSGGLFAAGGNCAGAFD